MEPIIIVEHGKIVIYRGVVFSIQGGCRYFQSYDKKLQERLLHRYVWLIEKGEIEKGHHIHHIDGNLLNNNISNLQSIASHIHQSNHMKIRYMDKKYSNKNNKVLESARIKASKWHRSDKGKEFHKKLSKQSWVKRKPHNKNCIKCGNIYQTFFPNRSSFCSNKCSQAYNSKVKRHKRQCERCDTDFYVSAPSKKTRFCSCSCSIKARNNININ